MIAKVLQRPTLVLNRNWQPVNVATVARALVLLWNESARVVDPTRLPALHVGRLVAAAPGGGRAFIQAVRLRLRVPEVIVLAEYDRLPTAAVSFSRRNIFKRDHWTCQYCGRTAGRRGADDRPRSAALARGRLDVGELRAGVHRLQQAQGRPHAAAGRHEAPPSSRSGRHGSRCTLAAACGSRVGRSSSARRTGTFRWKVDRQLSPRTAGPWALLRACSRESRRPPKPSHGVRLLALVFATWPSDSSVER